MLSKWFYLFQWFSLQKHHSFFSLRAWLFYHKKSNYSWKKSPPQMTKLQACHYLICLALVSLGECSLLFGVDYSILAAAFLMWLHPQEYFECCHSWQSYIAWLIVALPLDNRVEHGLLCLQKFCRRHTIQVLQQEELRIYYSWVS